MLVACFFMNPTKYEKSKDFNRNEAIYILHRMDKLPHEEIAKRFTLAIEEVQNIISLHAQYETLIVGEIEEE